MQRETPLPDELTEDMLIKAFPILSPAECRVLRWLCQAKKDAEIALIIGLAVATVSTHVRNMIRKLDVESRLALVIEVVRVVICREPRPGR